MQLFEAEKNKLESEKAHQEAALAYRELETRSLHLEKKLKKPISKSRYIIIV